MNSSRFIEFCIHLALRKPPFFFSAINKDSGWGHGSSGKIKTLSSNQSLNKNVGERGRWEGRRKEGRKKGQREGGREGGKEGGKKGIHDYTQIHAFILDCDVKYSSFCKLLVKKVIEINEENKTLIFLLKLISRFPLSLLFFPPSN
jgi:hypothetical protein